MPRRTFITGVAVVAALAVVSIFFIFKNPFAMQDTNNPSDASGASLQPTNTGLVVQDEVVGTGAQAQPGSVVTVNYTGKLQNGTVFDSSINRAPFQFTLGAGQVIPGWEQGIQGMRVGGKRLLIIPPQLAYGSQQVGPIPANSTLVFEVELLSVDAASSTPASPAGANGQ